MDQHRGFSKSGWNEILLQHLVGQQERPQGREQEAGGAHERQSVRRKSLVHGEEGLPTES